ncbi:MAG: hypothetical protein RBR22_09885 [Desulfuromonas sp.]|nr:hypothetical protein [Desulfuromonas sp.]
MREHRAELAGRVKLQISGGERGVIDYPWQDNMILDQGFILLITGYGSGGSPDALQYIGVGSSSQTVDIADTGLIAPIARISRGSIEYGWDEGGGFGWTRARATFANGLAAGNISELAVGPSNNNTSASARALVRDEFGNPTTITVLAGETLIVTWEWRRWWTVADTHVLEFDVGGVAASTTVTYKPVSELSKGKRCLGSGGEVAMGGTKLGGGNLISSDGGVFIGEFKKTYTELGGNLEITYATTEGDNYSGGRNGGGSVFPYDTAYATFTPPIVKTDQFKLEIYHRIRLTRRAP